MSFENDLCELGGCIADALESLRRAATLVMRISADGSDPENPGWPAMEELGEQLDAACFLIGELPGDEVGKAIRDANDYIDEMSDRADGVSY